MPRAARGWLRALLVVVTVVALDQAAKTLLSSHLGIGERQDLRLGIELVHVRNRGIAFGLLPGRGTVLTILTVAALAVLMAYFARHSGRRLLWLPTGLLLGGAIGNLIDRARLGGVTDWIQLPHWPAFNLADTCITLGVLVLIYVLERVR